jgi:hypothetical protein
LLLTATMGVAGLAPLATASTRKAAVAEGRKSLLVRSDFPKGWTTSSSSSSGNNLGNKQLAACLGVPVSEINFNAPTANSPEFDQNSTGLSVNDDVKIFPSVKVANEQFALFASPKSPVCIARAFNSPAVKQQLAKGFGAGMTVGTITATSLKRPSVALKAVALGLNIPIKDNGKTIPVLMDVAIMVSKEKGSELLFVSASGLPFPASLEAHLETVVAQRLG